MPTYKFAPNKEGCGPFISSFEVYDPIVNETSYEKITCGQNFYTDRYYSKKTMEAAEVDFISDAPYISPIICSYNGTDNNDLEVPDYKHLVNIYVSIPIMITNNNHQTIPSNGIKLYFNNNESQAITIHQYTGHIFTNISVKTMRIINTRILIPDQKFTYTIAVLASSNYYGFND